MKILVLGGTGFLGRNLVEQLLIKQYSATVLTRTPEKIKQFSSEVPYIMGDLLNYHKIDFSPFTHIINCSGELKNKNLMNELHVHAIQGVLNKLKGQTNIHWIQISSVGVYGKVKNGVVDENTPFAPVGEYEITKAKSEQLVKCFCLKHKISYTIIRPSNIFGCNMPNQSLSHLISFINRKIFFYIGSNSHRINMNYVPVEDVIYLIFKSIINNNALNEEFNISDYLPITEFVKIVCETLNIDNKFFSIPEGVARNLVKLFSWMLPNIITQARIDALTTRVKFSNKKAKTMLHYYPMLGIANGLKIYIKTLKKL